jgi:hypothetical protein
MREIIHGGSLSVMVNGESVGEIDLNNSVELEKETIPFNRNEYQYYMNRKGRYFFRNIWRKLSFDMNDDGGLEYFKKLKYGDLLTVNYEKE